MVRARRVRALGCECERLWTADGVTLNEVDTHAPRRIERTRVLDLLGDHLEVERARELDHRGHHRLVHGVAREIAHEGAVDLQEIHRQILEVRERADARAEIIQSELTTHAVQHADETPRVIEIGDHRVLGDLEADLRGLYAGRIETLDHEFQELHIPERLTRDVDGYAVLVGKLDRAARECSERRLHHPAVDESHQPVALRRAHEFRRRYILPGFVLEPHEHFHRGPRAVISERRDDDLLIELEAVLLERALQFLQPLDLAGVTRQRLIARRVHNHAPGSLLLGDIAGRVGGREQLLDRATLARDLDEPDRHADVEDLVLPDEAVIPDGAADVIGDLTRLLQRAADEQHAELVAAQAPDRVAIAHGIAQQLRHLPQHAVAGEVPARIVDDLEPVQVEVAQHVLPVAAMPTLVGLFQEPLELAAIDETSERIVGRLVGHLAREPAQLRHIVQEHDRADDLLPLVAHGCRRKLDRALGAVRARQKEGAAAQIDGRARSEGLTYGIAQQSPIRIVDEADDLLERLAHRILRGRARQVLSDGI